MRARRAPTVSDVRAGQLWQRPSDRRTDHVVMVLEVVDELLPLVHVSVVHDTSGIWGVGVTYYDNVGVRDGWSLVS